MARLTVYAVLLTLTLTSVSERTLAQGSPPADAGYRLRYVFTPGDVYTYKSSVDTIYTMDLGGGVPPGEAAKIPKSTAIHLESTDTWKVLAIRDSDGAAEVQISSKVNSETRNGQDNTAAARAEQAGEPPLFIYFRSDGALVGADLDTVSGTRNITVRAALSKLNFDISSITLPQAPIVKGGTWNSGAGSSGPATVVCTLDSVDPGPDGTIVRLVARDSATVTLPDGRGGQVTGPKSATTVILLNVNTGRLESITSSMETSMTGPLSAPIGGKPMTIDVVRQVKSIRTGG